VKHRFLIAVALLALLVPVAASAQGMDVQGPATLPGSGFFGGELKMADPGESRPVIIAGRRGHIGVLDLAGDLKVRCVGRGEAEQKETEYGTAYICKGLGGQVKILGSHFRFRGFAKRYVIHLPAGTSGTLHGRFRSGEGDRGERQTGDEGVRGERSARGAGSEPSRGDEQVRPTAPVTHAEAA